MAQIFYPARQVAAKVESTEGTQVSAASFGVADLVRTIDPTLELTPNTFARNLARRGHGTVPAHYASGTGVLRFGVEMVGHTANTAAPVTIPKWSKLLDACGARGRTLGSIAVTGGTITSGPIQHGEVLEGGTSTEVTTAFGYHFTGTPAVVVDLADNDYTSAETVTAGTSGATFAVGNVAGFFGDTAFGFGWAPQSVDVANTSLTIHFNIGGQRYQLYGCRGECELSITVHNVAVLKFTFYGIFDEVDASAALSELSASSYNDLPTAGAAAVNLMSTLTPRSTTGTEGTPISGADFCWTEGTLAFGNTVVVRPCTNGVNGYQAAVVSARAPTFTINPDNPGVAAYAYMQKLMEGSRARFYCAWGTPVGNRFILNLPHLQMRSSSMGERDSRLSESITFDATLGSNDGASDTSIGFDNEWTLINW